jgi:hypothetical protein
MLSVFFVIGFYGLIGFLHAIVPGKLWKGAD